MANLTGLFKTHHGHAGRGTAAEIHVTVRLVDVPSDLPDTDIPTGSRGLGPLTRVWASQLIRRQLTRDDIVSAQQIGENVIELCVLDRATHCARYQARMQYGRAVHEYARQLLGVSRWRYRTDPASRAEVRTLSRLIGLPGSAAEPHYSQPPVHRDGTNHRGA